MTTVFTILMSSLGVCQALFLATYLLTLKRGIRVANVLLAILLIALSVRVGKSVFNYYLDLDEWIRNLGIAALLAVGPAYYLYGKALAQQLAPNWLKTSLHFLPCVMFASFSWIIPNHGDFTSYMFYAAVMTHWAGYLLIAFVYRHQQLKLALNNQSLRWYSFIGAGLVIIWIYYSLVVLRIVPYYLGGALSYTVLVYGLAVLMLNRHHLVNQKYKNTGLPESENKEIVDKIDSLFRNQQLFLDPKLTINSLADTSQIGARQISQAINQQCNISFSDFVKQYRIEHAKRLLEQSRPRTKLAVIASESGFGNVTSFNNAFKTFVGCTPSEYRDAH